jgi:hypothetical protein
LVLYQSEETGGRPITLVGTDRTGWLNKGQYDALLALISANQVMTLVHPDGRQFLVRFRFPEPLSATPLLYESVPSERERWHSVKLQLIEVTE